jgi:GT2 family glycosyltransferase
MIYIVIPVFNRKQFTRECLQSLNAQTFRDFVVIVVDDGSTDGTEEMLKIEFPDVIILKGNNLWWTASTNLGIKYALQHDATYVMTLNNDTFAFPDYMEKMIYWAKQYPDAILGAMAMSKVDDTPIFHGPILSAKDTNKELKGLLEISHFPGRGCLIPKSVFDKIGLFDQKNFPHYYADYDFTQTAYENGFKIFNNFDAKLYIYPEESGDQKNRVKKSWKNYKNHLFGIKGGGNLTNFTRFALKHYKGFTLVFLLIRGYAARLLGYWLK